MLLLSQVNFISKKQCYKKDAFRICDFSCFKIILALLAEIITFHIQVLALSSLLQDAKFAYLYLWPQINNSRAKLIAL